MEYASRQLDRTEVGERQIFFNVAKRMTLYAKSLQDRSSIRSTKSTGTHVGTLTYS